MSVEIIGRVSTRSLNMWIQIPLSQLYVDNARLGFSQENIVSCKNTHKRGCKYSLVAEVITNHYIDFGNVQAFRDVVTEFFDVFLSTFVLTSPAFSALFKLVFISVIKIDSILKTSVIFQLVSQKQIARIWSWVLKWEVTILHGWYFCVWIMLL